MTRLDPTLSLSAQEARVLRGILDRELRETEPSQWSHVDASASPTARLHEERATRAIAREHAALQAIIAQIEAVA